MKVSQMDHNISEWYRVHVFFIINNQNVFVELWVKNFKFTVAKFLHNCF